MVFWAWFSFMVLYDLGAEAIGNYDAYHEPDWTLSPVEYKVYGTWLIVFLLGVGLWNAAMRAWRWHRSGQS
jgi:hypothetical protein